MPDKSVKVGNVLLNEVDQLALLNRYKSLYGEPKDDDETTQRMNDLVGSLARYKTNKLNTESDEAINNYFTAPWKSNINQAQNAIRYKTGVPISSLEDTIETPKQPKQPKATPVAQPKPVEAKEPAQIQEPTFWQRLTEQGAYTPEEQAKMKKRAEQSAMGSYATTYASSLAKSLWNGVGTIATGKIFDLFPGGAGNIAFTTPETRQQAFEKYFAKPGETLEYKPSEEEKSKTNETVRNIFGLGGDLTAFFVPIGAEEKIATGAAELLPKATNWLSRYGVKAATSAATQIPKTVPIIYGQSLDKGSKMGLTGDDLNNYARLNTGITWGAYSLIPNVLTGRFKADDKIVKTILNPNSKVGAKLLADVGIRAAGSGAAGTTAAAGDIVATNIYGPESERKDFTSPETLKELGTSFLTNAIIHTGFEARNIANAFKPSNVIYSNMVADMAIEKDKTEQLINQSVQNGATTQEEANKAITLLNKIEPYAKAAKAMPGVKPKYQGSAAFELARLEDLVKERNKQTTPDAIQEYNNKIDKSLETLNSLQNGTNFSGTLAKPQEILDMVAKHTPQGRLSPTQVFRMAGEYGFRQNEINPENFKDDPTVKEYIQQFKDGTLTPEENTSGMPIVIDSNGKIIDGKKRIAKKLFDAETNNTKANTIESLSPISESEIADGISDLNAINPAKQAEYARSKTIEFFPSMAETELSSTGKVSGVEAPKEGKKLTIGEAVDKVYHTAKENALESKQPVTEEDILNNTLTGEYDGQDINDVVKDFLSRYNATEESQQPAMMKAFVDEINKSKAAIRNPNVTAFRAAVEFALKAGIPKENIAKTLEGALGVKQQYIEGYMKVLEKKGLMPEVSKRSLFKAPEAKQPNVEVSKPEVKAEETKPKETEVKLQPIEVTEESVETPTSDIEKRRQEELKSEEYRTTVKSELFKGEDGSYYKVELQKNGKNKFSITDENGNTLTDLGSYDSSVPFDKIISGELTKVKDLKFTNKAVDKVNAKYDAELAALEEATKEKSKPEEPSKTRKEEVEYQIEQLEKAKEEKVKSLMDNGASKAEAEKIAEAEMPKADKKALKILKQELSSFEEKPAPTPAESDIATENEAPGSFDDSIAIQPEIPVIEEPVVEVEATDKELKNRKNEIIKSTNKKNLKDIFDILEKEGLLERDPNNTKDCI